MQIALSLQTWLARSIADLGNNLCQGTTKPSTCQTFIIIANLLKDYRNEGYALIQRMGFIIDSTPLLWRRRRQRKNTSSAEIKLTVSLVSGAAIQRTIPSDKQTIKKKSFINPFAPAVLQVSIASNGVQAKWSHFRPQEVSTLHSLTKLSEWGTFSEVERFGCKSHKKMECSLAILID